MKTFQVVPMLVAAALAFAVLAPAHAAQPAATGTLTLWHGWTGAEAEALTQAIGGFQSDNPSVQINTLAVPFDQLKNKFTIEASTGGGPDLLIGPKDWIGELAQANLIQSVDDAAPDILSSLNPAAVQANSYNGKVWAIPESSEAMALWINTSKVPNPPTSTDELLQLAPNVGVAINDGFYQYVGFIFAYGAQLFDANQKVILNESSGTAAALNWLKTAKATPGVTVDSDGSKLDALFTGGQVGMIFNGPWATADYAKALGRDKLAIAPPIRVGESGQTFAPFLGTKNLFLSANVHNQDAALAFARYLVSPDVQSTLASTAGHIPANASTSITDPIVAGFLTQTQSATYFPNEPEMGAVWTPAIDMITKVIEGKATADQAVDEATTTINRANKKEV